MPIQSKKQLGGTTMTIQPADPLANTKITSSPFESQKLTTSIPMETISRTMGGDVLQTQASDGSLNDYINPDLETAVSSLGFSTTRPALLAAFEFQPFLNERVVEESSSESSKSLSTNSSAELADLHSQLKQLRCSEVMEFLERYVGLTTRSLGAGIAFRRRRDEDNLLSDYDSKMDDAKLVIDTLTEIYNAILPIFEAMMIKTNDYKGSSTMFHMMTSTMGSMGGPGRAFTSGRSKLSNTNSGKIVRILSDDLYNNEWVESDVPGNISLSDYIRDYLNFRTMFWTSSSGNVILTQLMLDIVLRIFYPIYGYNEESAGTGTGPGGRTRGNTGGSSDSIKGYGYVDNTKESVSALRRLSNISVYPLGTDWSSNSTRRGHSGEFTKGDFTALWDEFGPEGDTSRVRLGSALYAAASDVMAYHSTKSDLFALSDYISKPKTSGDKIMQSLFGAKVGFTSKNISDMPVSKKETALAATFPSNTDSTTKGKVSAFSYSQKDLSEGTYPLRTGKSFYIDEIFTGEMGSVKRRLSRFQQNLSEIRSKLLNASQIMKVPTLASEDSGNFEAKTSSASGLTYELFKRASSQLSNTMENFDNGKWRTVCMLGLCVAAAEGNSELSYSLFKLYVNMHSVKGKAYNIMDLKTDQTGIAPVFQKLVNDVAESMLSLYPSFQGAPNSRIKTYRQSEPHQVCTIWRDNNGNYYSTDTLAYNAGLTDENCSQWTTEYNEVLNNFYEGDPIALGDASDSDVDLINKNSDLVRWEASDGEYFSRANVREALWTIIEEVLSGRNGSSSPLTFGFAAYDAFVGRSETIYGSEGLSKGGATTPLMDLTEAGVVGLTFFFQLQIWKTIKFMMATGEWIHGADESLLDYLYQEAMDPDSLGGAVVMPDEIYDIAEEWAAMEDYSIKTGNTYAAGARGIASLSYAFTEAMSDRRSPESIQEEIEGDDFQDPSAAGKDKWDGVTGAQGAIEKYLDMISLMYWKQVDSESNIWNSLWFVNKIITKMYSAVSKLLSTLEGNNLSAGRFEDVFDQIRGNNDLRKALFISLNRDQLALNSAMYDSLSVTNREYPYLPATKIVMTNQMKNLATMSTIGELVNTSDSGRKVILMIGVPVGFMNRLRDEAIDSGLGISYFRSSVISIKVWRRNMVDDSEITVPKEFKFDLSKFIIEGRRKRIATGSDVIDAATETEDGQTSDDVFNNTVVTTYNPEQGSYSTQGKAYSRDSLSESSKGIQIFQNLVLDYYLRMYVKLTSGFDVSEEIFPLQHGKLFFEGPDPDRTKLFNQLKKELAESFPTRDVTSAINYDRILGELTRSVLISPSKWANRVFYPKTFDRIFCVLIDESDFSTDGDTDDTEVGYDLEYVVDVSTGDVDYGSSAGSSVAFADPDETKPTYYQFYCTASLLSPMLDEQSEEESEMTAGVYEGLLSNANVAGISPASLSITSTLTKVT
jgi:hypothetical protein